MISDECQGLGNFYEKLNERPFASFFIFFSRETFIELSFVLQFEVSGISERCCLVSNRGITRALRSIKGLDTDAVCAEAEMSRMDGT